MGGRRAGGHEASGAETESVRTRRRGASAAVVRNLIATAVAAGLKVSQLSEDNIRAAHCSSIARFMEALEEGQVYALI